MFIATGMDFFDQHPYTTDVEAFAKEAAYDGPSKPLIFTEWGGTTIGQTEATMRRSVDRLIDLVETTELSGHAFWSWQDLREYSRVDPEMKDGVLISGVVSEAREPRTLVARELNRLFERRRHDVASRPNVIPLAWAPFSRGSTFECIDLQPLVDSELGKKSWIALEGEMEKFWAGQHVEDHPPRAGMRLWQETQLKINGVLFRCAMAGDCVRPILLTVDTPEFSVPVNRSCARLHILGQVTFPVGYPLHGRHGDEIATYTFHYADGTMQALPVRSGIEVAQSNRIYLATRITPLAEKAQLAVEYVKDAAREHYQVLLWTVPTHQNTLLTMRCKLNGQQPPLAIFAVTSERARPSAGDATSTALGQNNRTRRTLS